MLSGWTTLASQVSDFGRDLAWMQAMLEDNDDDYVLLAAVTSALKEKVGLDSGVNPALTSAAAAARSSSNEQNRAGAAPTVGSESASARVARAVEHNAVRAAEKAAAAEARRDLTRKRLEDQEIAREIRQVRTV